MDNKLKRIEDEIIGMVMEIVGTVWGVDMIRGAWTDREKTLFNNRVVDIRNRSLEKVSKIYRRKLSTN